MQARNIIALVLLGIFIVSLAFSFYYRISPTSDAKAYTRIARNLAAGQGYIANLENADDIARDDAIVRVGPGYEFFLAGIYWLMGGQSLEVVWAAQALVRVLTAFFIYKFAQRLFNNYQASLFAAVVFGFFPDFVVVGGMLLAETLFLFLLVVAAYFSLVALEGKRRLFVFLAGICWGLAALVRPTAIPMMLGLAVVLFFRKRFIDACIVLFITITLVGAWSLHNSLLYQRPLFTTTAGSYALWIGNNPDATGGYDKPQRIQDLISAKHSVDLSSLAFDEYFAFTFGHPFKFVELQFRKTILYFSLLRPMGFWIYLTELPFDQIVTIGASAFATAFLFIFGSVGAYMYFRENIRAKYFLFSVLLLQPLVVIPTYVETRYRYPLYLFLSIFAANAFLLLRDRKRVYRLLAFTALFFCAVSFIDLAYSFNIFYPRVQGLLQAVL